MEDAGAGVAGAVRLSMAHASDSIWGVKIGGNIVVTLLNSHAVRSESSRVTVP